MKQTKVDARMRSWWRVDVFQLVEYIISWKLRHLARQASKEKSRLQSYRTHASRLHPIYLTTRHRIDTDDGWIRVNDDEVNQQVAFIREYLHRYFGPRGLVIGRIILEDRRITGLRGKVEIYNFAVEIS